MTTNALNNQCLADFIVTSGTGGVERILSTTNTVDAAGSAAKFVTSVAGATASDAKYQVFITGGQTWSWGLDNSDSDAYVIAGSTTLGTTNVERNDTIGVITYPLQTAFLAVVTNSQTNKTGNGTTYTFGTDALTEIFDQNSDLAAGGTFTAPVTGGYFLSGQFFTGGWSGAAGTYIQTQLVTSNRTYLVQDVRENNSNDISSTVASLCDMDAADTAYITLRCAGEAGDIIDFYGGTNPATYFYGRLVC